MLSRYFIRLTQNIQLYETLKYSLIKFVKKQKISQLKYYHMVQYKIKISLLTKLMLKPLPFGGINNYL